MVVGVGGASTRVGPRVQGVLELDIYRDGDQRHIHIRGLRKLA